MNNSDANKKQVYKTATLRIDNYSNRINMV